MSRPRPTRRSAGRLADEVGEDADERAADLLGDVAVDLVAVEAADVVGLEDLGGDGHGGASYVSLAAMAGHSKWAGIKHKKAIVDARRGKLFTKLARAITVAAKEGGGDLEGNPALALAVQKAKDASMPKDNIERAIAKGTGEGADADALEAVSYEGYGPGGVAILVEALTDNRNRTGADMRHLFSKHGGNLGEPGSVAYLFDKRGLIVVDGRALVGGRPAARRSRPGALDVTADDDVFEVLTEPADLAAVRAALEEAGVEPESAEARAVPAHAGTARGGGRAPASCGSSRRWRTTTTWTRCTRTSTWTPRCWRRWRAST